MRKGLRPFFRYARYAFYAFGCITVGSRWFHKWSKVDGRVALPFFDFLESTQGQAEALSPCPRTLYRKSLGFPRVPLGSRTSVGKWLVGQGAARSLRAQYSVRAVNHRYINTCT